ncbi:MAG: HAD-IA family hydrolase [Hyphomicrobiaceae bacterium]
MCSDLKNRSVDPALIRPLHQFWRAGDDPKGAGAEQGEARSWRDRRTVRGVPRALCGKHLGQENKQSRASRLRWTRWSAGARLAVCTNKREEPSRQLLGQLGLANRFGAIAGRDTFAVYKPHPDHLLGVIKLAGGEPANAVMIGDSATDIKTARAAGLPVIAVPFGYTDVPVAELGPDAVIEHDDELIEAIARVRPAATK